MVKLSFTPFTMTLIPDCHTYRSWNAFWWAMRPSRLAQSGASSTLTLSRVSLNSGTAWCSIRVVHVVCWPPFRGTCVLSFFTSTRKTWPERKKILMLIDTLAWHEQLPTCCFLQVDISRRWFLLCKYSVRNTHFICYIELQTIFFTFI